MLARVLVAPGTLGSSCPRYTDHATLVDPTSFLGIVRPHESMLELLDYESPPLSKHYKTKNDKFQRCLCCVSCFDVICVLLHQESSLPRESCAHAPKVPAILPSTNIRYEPLN